MTDLTNDQRQAIKIAHDLVDMGAPIFPAARNHSLPLTARMPFHLPTEWQNWRPNHGAVDRWRPGMALAMVTGVVFDVLDIDPRNGGEHGWQELEDTNAIPVTYALAYTPSGGRHRLIARTHLAKGKPAEGVDLQAGQDDGEGRGFIFIAPTVRVSRWGPMEGQEVAYKWGLAPVLAPGANAHSTTEMGTLIDLASARKPTARLEPAVRAAAASGGDDWDAAEDWTAEAAQRLVDAQIDAVRAARAGEVNSTLGGAARVLGRFVAGGWLDRDSAIEHLMLALAAGGVHSDDWNRANGVGWVAESVIQRGLAQGEDEPWTVAEPITPNEVDISVRSDIGYPRLLIQGPATMAYWLAQEAGRERLAGFFLRQGQVVHTPRVSEIGYVPAPEGDDNGPAEIRPVTGRVMASKIQFLYSCYKVIKGKKDEPDREVPAMFPIAAAEAVTNAPEAAQGLRVLRGITHTPMVRSDGSILDAPGYDKASGYLFVPGQGVNVPTVPEHPTLSEVASAVSLLETMLEGFPFATQDDLANYIGMLITPLLRLITPPSYKMFGISAHQPGSGKSLLAEIMGTIHGAVFRSEVPVDEAEWGKQTASILSATSSPVVVLDNVTGVLKSSTLAGLLTSTGEQTSRELGKSVNLTYVNDRVWVVTGNNLSLGGDLVRRTITVLIDPDMVNPETRTDFKIQDLPAWVRVNRNALLHALLVIVRHWVSCGMPLEARKQSDGFATWERAVGGILAAASVAGNFDAESGKRVAAGGDDDGLATVLERMYGRFQGLSWTVAQALEPEGGDWVEADRDWLPAPVLDRFGRGEARGRQSFGKWLRFRLGRWVTGSDGTAYVLREAGLQHKIQTWRVDMR